MKTIPLPSGEPSPLERILRERRSLRSFSGAAVPLESIARLLFAAQGVTEEERGTKLRTAPSAGALYPLDLYLVAVSVTGLEPGLYRYLPAGHALEEIRIGDLSGEIHSACLKQDSTLGAAAFFILTDIPKRMVWKYRDRSARYAALEAGAASQNLHLTATTLALGTVMIGAFDDMALAAILGVELERERPLLVHPVGVPK